MTEGTKKLFDIAEAFCKKVPCETSVAMVYARPLASGRWSTVSASDDPATVGEAAIRMLTGSQEKAEDETTLDDELFSRLTLDDIQNLAAAIAKANRLGDLPPEADPYEGLGELIIRKQAQAREEAKQLRERHLSATFGQSIAEKLKDQLNGMDSMREAIRKSSFPAVNSTLIPPPQLHFPAPEATPIGRAMIETSQHVAKVADQSANLVATISELTDTIVGQAIPEWRKQVAEEKEASVEANDKAVQNLKVATDSLETARNSLKTAQNTLWITIGIALATMVIQIGQFIWSEIDSAKERDKQAETDKQRHEDTLQVLRDQLTAQQKFLSQTTVKPQDQALQANAKSHSKSR